MKAWTRPGLGEMPQRQRHMVQIDAKRYPELAGLLWTAGFGQKSQLMLDLLEAGRRHLLKEQHKRSDRGSQGAHGDLESGGQRQRSRTTAATTPPATTLPSPPATDTSVTAVPAPDSDPPSLGVRTAFID